jgi:hypothetical protein
MIQISDQNHYPTTVFQGPQKYTITRGLEPYRGGRDILSATLFLQPDTMPIEIPVNKLSFLVPDDGTIRVNYECRFPSVPELLQPMQQNGEFMIRWWGSYNRITPECLYFVSENTIELKVPLRYGYVHIKTGGYRMNGVPNPLELTLSPWYISNPDTFQLPFGTTMVTIRFRITPRFATYLSNLLE